MKLTRTRNPRVGGLTLAAAALALLPNTAGAQPGKCLSLQRDGGSFRAAQESTTFDKRFPKIADDAQGNYVVIWESFGTNSGSDDDRQSVQGRRYFADGSPNGAQFQANNVIADEQRFPDVGMAADGRFVVVWQSGTAFGEKSVRARVYRPDGSALGQEFQVNTTPFNPGGSSSNPVPKVDMAPNGDFVVVWESETTTGNDNDSFSVQGQRFSRDGTKRGGQFQLNTQTARQQKSPNVAMSADGSFTVGWIDWQDRKVKVRRYAANGAAQGPVHALGGRVSLFDTPAIATAAQGHSLVAWSDGQSAGSDQDDTSIQAQGLDAQGTPVGAAFQVNQVTADDQTEPEVGVGPAGDFVVVWTSETTNGNDADGNSVQARHIAAPGRFFDVQFQLNDEINKAQSDAAVAIGPAGAVTAYFSQGLGDDIAWETMIQPLEGAVSPNALCLSQKRFLVEADWRDFRGNTGKGSVVAGGSDDSGLFWFFNADNWEMLVKVIDGCALNNRFWVFAAATTDVKYDLKVTDLWSGVQKVYSNPLGRAADAITDSNAFATCDVGNRPEVTSSPIRVPQPSVTPGALPGWQTADLHAETSERGAACNGQANNLCLSGNRFQATVDFRTAQGTSGSAQRVNFGSDDSGLFWFFNKDNWEMLVKVIDGCALNGHFWVFSAATTDVEYTLTLQDTVGNGGSKQYFNPLGTAAPAITDTMAIPCN
ncbi:MAG: hypothetical protein AAF690_20005 [Acidobacteriota bacterium]